jgi:hypothetical protein
LQTLQGNETDMPMALMRRIERASEQTDPHSGKRRRERLRQMGSSIHALSRHRL